MLHWSSQIETDDEVVLKKNHEIGEETDLGSISSSSAVICLYHRLPFYISASCLPDQRLATFDIVRGE